MRSASAPTLSLLSGASLPDGWKQWCNWGIEWCCTSRLPRQACEFLNCSRPRRHCQRWAMWSKGLNSLLERFAIRAPKECQVDFKIKETQNRSGSPRHQRSAPQRSLGAGNHTSARCSHPGLARNGFWNDTSSIRIFKLGKSLRQGLLITRGSARWPSELRQYKENPTPGNQRGIEGMSWASKTLTHISPNCVRFAAKLATFPAILCRTRIRY